MVNPTNFIASEVGSVLLTKVPETQVEVIDDIKASAEELERILNPALPEKAAIIYSLKKPRLEASDVKIANKFTYMITLALKEIWANQPLNDLSGEAIQPILKMAIVQISLCLTYQQAMEFRDDETMLTELEAQIETIKNTETIAEEYERCCKSLVPK